MIILGIDPGTALCGFGLVESLQGSLKPIHFGVISSSSNIPLPHRLLNIFSNLNSIILSFKPDVIAVENLFFGKNSTTAIAVAQARGVILLCAAIHNLQLLELAPNDVKLSISGYGLASKHQVIFMVTKILNLPEPPSPDDAADALAIACAASFLKRGSS